MATLSELRDIRIEKLNKLKELGIDPYPARSEKDYSNAKIIEKHFKLNDDCVDAEVSITPSEFKEMVDKIRRVEAAKAEALKTD